MKLPVLTATFLCLLGSGAYAECMYPPAPAGTPDCLTATQEEMMAGMQAVKDYNDRVTTYLDCLEKELAQRLEAAGPDATSDQVAQIMAIHHKRHNAAVEALEAHAAQFNEQVKTFKARNKS